MIFTILGISQLKIWWLWKYYSVNPLYLIIGRVDGHIEENNEHKYLVFDSTEENKEVLKKV